MPVFAANEIALEDSSPEDIHQPRPPADTRRNDIIDVDFSSFAADDLRSAEYRDQLAIDPILPLRSVLPDGISAIEIAILADLYALILPLPSFVFHLLRGMRPASILSFQSHSTKWAAPSGVVINFI